jgi:hypothetical protein
MMEQHSLEQVVVVGGVPAFFLENKGPKGQQLVQAGGETLAVNMDQVLVPAERKGWGQ